MWTTTNGIRIFKKYDGIKSNKFFFYEIFYWFIGLSTATILLSKSTVSLSMDGRFIPNF
jgi:hypothetical protein